MLISITVPTTLGGPCPSACVPASLRVEGPQGQGPSLGSVCPLGRVWGRWLSHAPRGHKHPCGLRTRPARVFLGAGFLSPELMTPPPPCPGGSVCPALRTLFYRLCLRSGVGPALSRRPPQCCVSENHFKSHGSTPFANLLTGRLLIIITELAVLSEAVGSLGPASRLPRRARGAILSDPSRKSFIHPVLHQRQRRCCGYLLPAELGAVPAPRGLHSRARSWGTETPHPEARCTRRLNSRSSHPQARFDTHTIGPQGPPSPRGWHLVGSCSLHPPGVTWPSAGSPQMWPLVSLWG